jgi:hypothetical protein
MSPPINDNFASAIALSTTLPGTRTGDTTVDATDEVGEPSPYFGLSGSDVAYSVWYSFTPTHDGIYRFRVYNTNTIVWTDVKAYTLGIYSGSSVNALTALATTYGPCGTSELSQRAHLTSGVT